MSLRPAELAAVTAEVDEALRGAFLQKAWAPERSTVYLELRQPGRSTRLCLCTLPDVARLSTADARVPAAEAAPLQRWLRQHLVGAQLVGARAVGNCVQLDFATRSGPRALALDLGERLLLLLGEGGRVLATSSDSGPAPKPGSTWILPDGAATDERPSRLRVHDKDAAPLPLLRAAEALLGSAADSRRATALRRALVRPLRSRRAQLLRTLDKVRAEAARGPDAERHRRFGELLAHNVHRLSRGARAVVLTEWTEHGAVEVEVPLDATRPPRDQAERHFHLYRRLTRGAEHATRRLEVLTAELQRLEGELQRVESLPDEALAGSPVPTPRPGRATAPRHVAFREFHTPHGRVLVGKGGSDNDTLTFQRARPFDVWMHALGLPGAHVVVPVERGAEVSERLLIDAAHLALHFSPARAEPRGEVAWTYARFVRKPRDGAPGAVFFTRERVLVIRLERDRLERLLATQDTPPSS
jgi:predicted ribosome quality control (RQC) complex YloA/Tae2 family protein